MLQLLFAAVTAGPVVGGSWGIGQIAIAVVIVAAVVGLVFVGLRQFGVQIPAFVVQCGWIVLCAFVVILAIKLVLSM